MVLAVVAWEVGAALGTPVTQTVGPFHFTFYNKNDSDSSASSTQDWTQTQIDDVLASAQVYVDTIHNTPGSRLIEVHYLWNSFGGTLTLGSSLNFSTGNGITSYTDAQSIWAQGSNPTLPSAGYDSQIVFSTNAAGVSGGWNYGTGTPASNKIDFRSVVTHELGHTLGFYPTYDSSTGKWGEGVGLDPWDKNLRDVNNTAPQLNVANGFVVTSPVTFAGTYATSFYGGNVPIYSPSTFEEGSSLAHLNDATFPNSLMKHAIAAGTTARGPTTLEWQIMEDLGYVINKTWTKGNGTLNWGDNGNWGIPAAADGMSNAIFTSAGISAGDTVNLGGSRSVRALTFDTNVTFSVGAAGNTLTLTGGEINRTTASAGTQTITSPVVLGSNGVWTIDGGGQLHVGGNVSGSFSLKKSGAGVLVLAGTNSYSGGTTVSEGVVRFDNANAIPSTGTITIAAGGYAGFDFAATSTTLSKINTTNTHGVIGFDADTTANISLSSFQSDVRLGSSTAATLSGTITPRNTIYRFGGGGGTLTITSGLANGSPSRSLEMGTSGTLDPGVVVLSGTNVYKGGTTVNAGILRFANSGAVPNVGTTTITVAAGGYVGFGYALDQTTLNKAGVSGTHGVVGLDADSSNALSFASTSIASDARLGSSTAATLSGAFTPKGNVYHLGGGGGTLTISSNLLDNSGATSLDMGTSGTLAAGAVVLTGANSYTGGTTVSAGTLVLGTKAGNNSLSSLPSTGPLSIAADATVALRSQAANGNAKGLLVRSASNLALAGYTFGNTATTPTGTLDMADGDAIFTSGVSTDDLRHLLAAGYNATAGGGVGDWSGKGITSSVAKANPLYAVAYASADEYNGLFTDHKFDGQTLTSGQTILRYTYGGDANFDNLITMDDYLAIDAGYLFGGTDWVQGDFDYSGSVTSADYAIIDQAYRAQVGQAADSMIALHTSWFGADYVQALEMLNVPEPASLVFVVGGLGVLYRRGKR